VGGGCGLTRGGRRLLRLLKQRNLRRGVLSSSGSVKDVSCPDVGRCLSGVNIIIIMNGHIIMGVNNIELTLFKKDVRTGGTNYEVQTSISEQVNIIIVIRVCVSDLQQPPTTASLRTWIVILK